MSCLSVKTGLAEMDVKSDCTLTQHGEYCMLILLPNLSFIAILYGFKKNVMAM